MNRSLSSGIVFAWLVLSSWVSAEGQTLKAKLMPLLEAHKGKVSVMVRPLASEEVFAFQADEPMPTASLIKLAVLVELYLQVQEEKLKLTDQVVLHDRDKVPGSGILTEHFSEGARLSLRDCARLMMAFSDNTATNLVLERVGLKAVNFRMQAWGLNETKIHAQVFRGSTTSIDAEGTRRYGLGVTTAGEMTNLLGAIMLSERLRPSIKQSVLGHLRANTDTKKFTCFLPSSARAAHKGGAVTRVRTTAGILFTDNGPIVVCILTAKNEDQRWHRNNAADILCGRLTRIVWDHFQPSETESNRTSAPRERKHDTTPMP